jgi:hypothetical protein
VSRHLLAATVLAGAAVSVLAGCSASGSAGTPQVSQWNGTGAASSANAVASATGAAQGSRSGNGSSGNGSSGSGSGAGATSTSNSYVAPRSITFPVTVGDTWVYQTSAGGVTGRSTDRIISSGPTSAGYQVVMSQTTTAGGAASYAEPVYTFYPNGTAGFPVPDANGVSVQGNGVTWPDAAGLASGRAYHSAVRISVDKAGAIEEQNADVTVQGAGTTTVTVPAGTYRALVVTTTLSTSKDGVTTTVQVKTWLAANTGPVKSVVVTQVGGKIAVTTTSVLLSFGRGVSQADGS